MMNIEGLYPGCFKSKLPLLAETLSDNNSFLCALTESHLKPHIRDAEIHIEGFTPFRTDRAGARIKGGIITYVKSPHTSFTKVLLSHSNSYTEVQVLQLEKLDLVIVTVYRPPECPHHLFNEPMERLKETLHSLPPPLPSIVLLGDLNFPLINWASETVYGGSNEMRQSATTFLTLADSFCLTQLVDIPTRNNNILDLFLTNNEELVHDIRANPTNLSDHNIVEVATSVHLEPSRAPPQPLPRTPSSFLDLNFMSDRVDWESLNTHLAEIPWEQLLEGADSTAQYNIILEQCLQAALRFVPPRKCRLNKQIPRDRRILMRKRSRLQKRLQAAHNNTALSLRAKINEVNALLRSSVDNELADCERQAVAAIKKNPKYFFKYAATKAKTHTPVGPFTNPDGIIIDSAPEICEALRCQYESVFSTPLADKEVPDPSSFFSSSASRIELCDVCITPTIVHEALKELPNNSAPGPDQIPSIFLKSCASALSLPLSLFYRSSLDSGTIPTPLKCGKITPVFKGGSRGLPKNYRPIILSSHIIKALEKIVGKEITTFLESSGLMNPNQHGFRSGHSCLSQLLAHHECILSSLELGHSMDVVYLDFAKAFDKVDHGVLLHKVQRLGITGLLGCWLHCFLTNRSQIVACSGAVSTASPVLSGVPQGSVLGPLLFLIHISDIDERATSSSVASFADDTRVMLPITSSADPSLLQEDLNHLYDWAMENNMSFNNNKFEHLPYPVFPLGENPPNTYHSPSNESISTCSTVRDLGVTLSGDATFSTHIATVAKTARGQAGWILRTFATREPFPMLTLYKALVIPLLEYCCQLWSPWLVGDKQRLEAIQRAFTFRIQSVRDLDYWERLRALGLYSLERRRERYAIIYTWKIATGLTNNNIGLTFHDHSRHGRRCAISPIHSRASTRVKTLKENSFSTRGGKLFNAIPKVLRDPAIDDLTKFKTGLDAWLKLLPDKPSLPHYHFSAASNSILDQLAALRAAGTYL